MNARYTIIILCRFTELLKPYWTLGDTQSVTIYREQVCVEGTGVWSFIRFGKNCEESNPEDKVIGGCSKVKDDEELQFKYLNLNGLHIIVRGMALKFGN